MFRLGRIDFDTNESMKAASVVSVVMLAIAGIANAGDNKTISIRRGTFAAVAYSPSTGKYGYSYNLRSRAAAERTALEKCPEPDARVVAWVERGFLTLALGNDKSCWGVGWSYGNGASTVAAKEYALEDCKKRTTGAQVALVLASDGEHVWDRLDHEIVIDKDGNVTDGRGRSLLPSPSPGVSASPGMSASPVEDRALPLVRPRPSPSGTTSNGFPNG
jgi:hypothetical protein